MKGFFRHPPRAPSDQRRYLKRSFALGFTSVVGLATLAMVAATSIGANAISSGRPAPEFTHNDPSEWINSKPLSLSELRGKVVMLDIWTFDCWNCYRSFPWLKQVEHRFADQGLQVVGVHTPEFSHEKIRKNIEAKVVEFNLHHPVMIDNDFSYWRALGNRFWPTYYLIDKTGTIRGRFIGETHAETPQARKIEDMIAQLIEE